MRLTDVIKKPLVSEKSMKMAESNCYTFIVDREASKDQIKQAVETVFGVKVIGVKTVIIKQKTRRLSNRRRVLSAPIKKATIKLKEGEKLKIYEN